MFVTIDEVVHVTDPNNRKVLSLLRCTKTNHLQKRYVTIILAIGGLFLAPGLLTFFVTAIFYTQWQPKAAGVIVLLLCITGALFLGRAAIAISRDNQARRFKKYVEQKEILQLPKVPSELFLTLLSRADSLAYLDSYRPTPYDLNDIASIIKDYEHGLRSKWHTNRTHKPILKQVGGRITEARKAAEEKSAAQADALRDLPRPSGD